MLSLCTYGSGTKVIFHSEKQGRRPAPHAEVVLPAMHGENYRYWVPKFWIVEQVLPDGQLLVRTRRGKTRCVDPHDPNLRPASWWERLRYADRFPAADEHPTCVVPKMHTA